MTKTTDMRELNCTEIETVSGGISNQELLARALLLIEQSNNARRRNAQRNNRN